MSNTPLTDELVKKHHADWPMWDWNDHASAYLEWAKELERRNAALQEALEFYAGRLRSDGNGFEFDKEAFQGEVARAVLLAIKEIK